ncbi:MAG: LamG-like jellyroll fold domain-containing protein [Bacteroidales bacterium]|nr:LamG-like jellyroll fold domain-containing protein [Bacteroidales bacterium]
MKKWMTSLLAGLLAIGMSAQTDEGLIIRYNFENVSGKTVTDASGNGINGTLVNQAKVEAMGKYHVLNLGNGTGYLNMGTKAGTAIKALSDWTLSVYYNVDAMASLSGAGYFLWCFSQSDANTATSAPYTAYRLNVQRMATSTGGFQNEVGMEIGSESVKGRWVHFLYTQSGMTGRLYLDGVLKQTVTNMPVLSSTFTAAPAYNWIGRAPFSADNYLKQTLVYDFRVYNKSMTEAEVKALAAVTEDLEYEYRYGTPGDFSALESKLTECETFVASIGNNYPANAIAEMQDEILCGKMELRAGRISQQYIDQRITQLTNALNTLKASKGFNMKKVSGDFASEHGFVHPGCLHTQADFDRIKQLLAAGDPTITAAFNALRNGEYAQSGIATWPVETIIRGGSSGQNYMNVARGAAMAYQNALVWKIAGTKANADAAVRILMAWARGNKYVGGDTNVSLASGIYGYELANAAELVRDYAGWSPEDLAEFKQYVLNTWYGPANDFLRRRHATWDNSQNPGAGGQRPGHYWSNWGLCNTLAMMCWGIFLDDVHMYNQGVSFFKHDHVGTWSEAATLNRTEAINNWGLTEFLGNLVPVVHDDARGPYGRLGQMQETGRDAGHEQMAAGLAVDIAQVGWNQGDDLFSYMDHRLAAGLEYVAAHNFGGQGATLPWTNYHYADCRTAWHNAWVQTGHEDRGEMRPFWDRVVGHYEGVKGVKMQYSEMAARAVRGDAGYDMGGHSYGENSGGYDHLGFSTLTCYRPEMADPAKAPIFIDGQIEHKGKTYHQTELGGLKYTFIVDGTHAFAPSDTAITLIPILPEGVADTGLWKWNTGQTTKNIQVSAKHSYMYRVTYTDANGTESQRLFSIAVAGDCTADRLHPEITVDGVIEQITEKSVFAGTSVILYTGNQTGWTDDYRWDNGVKNNSVVVIPNITTSRDYVCHYTNTGGRTQEQRFHLNVVNMEHHISVGDKSYTGVTDVIAEVGSTIVITPKIADLYAFGTFQWSDGSTGRSLTLENIQSSQEVSFTYTCGDVELAATYNILLLSAEPYIIESGNYLVEDVRTGLYMTNDGGKRPVFEPLGTDGATEAQVWNITQSQLNGKYRYHFMSTLDNAHLGTTGSLSTTTGASATFLVQAADKTDYIIFHSASNRYWSVDEENALVTTTVKELYGFPFRVIPASEPTGIESMVNGQQKIVNGVFDLTGRPVSHPTKGLYIIGGKNVYRR